MRGRWRGHARARHLWQLRQRTPSRWSTRLRLQRSRSTGSRETLRDSGKLQLKRRRPCCVSTTGKSGRRPWSRRRRIGGPSRSMKQTSPNVGMTGQFVPNWTENVPYQAERESGCRCVLDQQEGRKLAQRALRARWTMTNSPP